MDTEFDILRDGLITGALTSIMPRLHELNTVMCLEEAIYWIRVEYSKYEDHQVERAEE